MAIDQATAEILLEAVNVIEKQANETRGFQEREAQLNEKLDQLISHMSDKGVISPEKRAYLETRVGKDNLEVLSSLEKSASRYGEDSSLGSPSATQMDIDRLDPIAKFALS